MDAVSDGAALVAGRLLADDSAPKPSGAGAFGAEGLRIRLDPISLWQLGDLSPELRGEAACGQDVVRLRVDGPEAVRHLRATGDVDGLTIVPAVPAVQSASSTRTR